MNTRMTILLPRRDAPSAPADSGLARTRRQNSAENCGCHRAQRSLRGENVYLLVANVNCGLQIRREDKLHRHEYYHEDLKTPKKKNALQACHGFFWKKESVKLCD